MCFFDIIKILQEKFEISIIKQSDLKILDIVFLTTSPETWCSHTLYIGNISHITTPIDRPIMLLNKIKNASFEASLPDKSCYAILHTKDIKEVYNISKDLVFENLKSESVLFEITQANLKGKNINFVINSAASMVGNELILIDSNLKVLAYSNVFDIMDPLWSNNIKRGFLDYDFMQKVRLNKDMQDWSKSGQDSKIITLEGDIQPKLVTRITQKCHLVGALIMIAHHTPITNSHLKQLPKIGKILFDTFNNGNADNVYKSLHSTILFHLLSGEKISDGYDHLTMSKADFPKEMIVVVARFIKPNENRYLKQNIFVILEKIFPKGYLVQYKNYICILVASISLKQQNSLTELAELENINIGISWPFSDLLDFKKFFNQAVASLKQAQVFGETHKVLNYTSYCFYDFLFHYTGKIAMQNFCHPALQILNEYDKAYKTELYMTLKTFLKSDRNLGTTAEALFLHRNSVTYRINRIVELAKLDLNDINTIYALAYSYKINSFLETSDLINSL